MTACRWIASTPQSRPVAGPQDSFMAQPGAADAAASLAAANASAWQGGVQAEVRPGCTTPQDIAAEDWDLLFRAALESLERVAVEKTVPCESRVPWPVPPGSSLRECLQALDRLRRSLPRAGP